MGGSSPRSSAPSDRWTALVQAYFTLISQRARLVLIIALASVVPMGFWSAQLFGDVRADLKELLPEKTPSVQTLRELERRVGTWSELAIVIESPSRDANRRFSDDLVTELSRSGRFLSVQNKIGAERAFFTARRHLFMDESDLEKILEHLHDAKTRARARANPLLVDLADETPFDWKALVSKSKTRLETLDRFPDDYFENPDGTRLAILARKRGLALGINESREIVSAVEETVLKLAPGHYHQEMRVQLGGDVTNIVEEHDALVDDISVASIVTGLLLVLLIIAYYRSIRSLAWLTLPLAVGLSWTFGLGHFLVGHLNASSAFLGPIVAGNGINFGLILLSRYFEERRAGRPLEESIQTATLQTARSTAVAPLAAAIAYGSLMATGFRGFSHFGLIGGIGMLLSWVATFAVLPPLIVCWEERWPIRSFHQRRSMPFGGLMEMPATWIARRPRFFAVIGVLLGLLSIGATAAFFRDPLEKDFEKLRSSHSRARGASSVSKKVDELFGRYTVPQVILARTEDEVSEIVGHLEKEIRAQATEHPISHVYSIATFVPPRQDEKIRRLVELRSLLDEEVLSSLDPKERKRVEDLRPPEPLQPFTSADLPESIRSEFRELNGHEGLIVLAIPNYKLNLYHADEIGRVADALRNIPISDGRTVRSSGNFVIYADMFDLVATDGPKATLYSLFGVLVLCMIAFRRSSGWLVVGSTLLLGVSWLFALLYFLDLKINFLNFIALPITFGIGADYAVNVYSRYHLELTNASKREAAQRALVLTGGAVLLCSLTTIIGYGSLLFAHQGSLISFGQVAILGELACLCSAVVVLPAWLS